VTPDCLEKFEILQARLEGPPPNPQLMVLLKPSNLYALTVLLDVPLLLKSATGFGPDKNRDGTVHSIWERIVQKVLRSESTLTESGASNTR